MNKYAETYAFESAGQQPPSARSRRNITKGSNCNGSHATLRGNRARLGSPASAGWHNCRLSIRSGGHSLPLNNLVNGWHETGKLLVLFHSERDAFARKLLALLLVVLADRHQRSPPELADRNSPLTAELKVFVALVSGERLGLRISGRRPLRSAGCLELLELFLERRHKGSQPLDFSGLVHILCLGALGGRCCRRHRLTLHCLGGHRSLGHKQRVSRSAMAW
mmetsp:Transcript_8610/g.24594  ORF Transcript_8610/g.24594 Transcript_8610/m.24594 type:complete len:222 (-) Transcript_8610:6-671(-)